jgi:hypothetical protein
MNRLLTAFDYLNRADDDPEAWALAMATTMNGCFLRIPHAYVTLHPRMEIVSSPRQRPVATRRGEYVNIA